CLCHLRANAFRVLCVVGLNFGEYPRNLPPLDFDLLRNDYRPGDRSRREDHRYLLLDAQLTAPEQHYVSCVGRSNSHNRER
ncbi:hypothetical protein ACPTGO_31260, partial [Pseudomonas aeruginosa]|uniref:hypothetical protein n=1 Tax=Pseudomonas aeruginosa TaxID=287 RepID=UPI003CC65ED7